MAELTTRLMPASAFPLLGTFVVSATLIAIGVTWIVGPHRRAAFVLPVAAAVVALGSVGHELKLGFGPTVNLFGYEVRLVFDLGLALVVALVVALVPRACLARRRTTD